MPFQFITMRLHKYHDLNFPSGTDSSPVEMRRYTGGNIHFETWDGGDITFEACHIVDGTYQPLYYDGAQVGITGVSAGNSYVLPASLFACGFIKVIAASSPTAPVAKIEFKA